MKTYIVVGLLAVTAACCSAPTGAAQLVPTGPHFSVSKPHAAHAPPLKVHAVKGRRGAKVKTVKSYPLTYMGVAENMAMTTDSNMSRQIVSMAQTTGYNLLRVNAYFQLQRDHTIWTQAPTDPSAVCNAAVNAANAGMTLMTTFMPTNNRGYPQTPDELQEVIGSADTKVDGYVGDFLGALYDPASGCANGRDGKPLVKLIVQIGNEMNIDTFCSPQTDDDHLLCAQIAAIMQSQLYHYVKQVEEPRYGVSLPVAASSVASHHTPWQFWAAYKHKMDVLTQCICADMIDYHPYPLWGSSDQSSGFTNYNVMLASCRLTYGRICGTAKLPILYGEWAAQTAIPDTKTVLYSSAEQPSPLVIPESLQGTVTQNYVNYCRLQHVLGCVVFHVVDEPILNIGFQSGAYYPDLTPKSSQPAIRQAVLKAFAPLSLVKSGSTAPGVPPQ